MEKLLYITVLRRAALPSVSCGAAPSHRSVTGKRDVCIVA